MDYFDARGDAALSGTGEEYKRDKPLGGDNDPEVDVVIREDSPVDGAVSAPNATIARGGEDVVDV
ncbi:hypothetical protein DOTSEDRAFT_26765 [Dothistroma septosporum NZE10]|uniref:Uncharacterized protein n=1 Tax=Dothistroma septosporum (strain NZE10 / CBS 128990) TaxID=675120 RepID=N1PJY5_DOTSN|nr:hypothetical protein DOTSEDRAFT_26765 [Dothistroma septosporum NZE10]